MWLSSGRYKQKFNWNYVSVRTIPPLNIIISMKSWYSVRMSGVTQTDECTLLYCTMHGRVKQVGLLHWHCIRPTPFHRWHCTFTYRTSNVCVSNYTPTLLIPLVVLLRAGTCHYSRSEMQSVLLLHVFSSNAIWI